MVHRITFSFIYFLFTYALFIHFILDIINGVLYPVKLHHFPGKRHSHFSVLPHTTLACDCFRTELLASVIYSQSFRSLDLSCLSPAVLKVR